MKEDNTCRQNSAGEEIFVQVRNLTKRFQDTIAVNDSSFEVRKGEFLTMLGPSGCGKTTTLRCIAGFENPEEGEIFIGSRCVTNAKKKFFLPPEHRNYGMVFQSYAIWPHMTVAENVGYGLKMRGIPRSEIEKKIREVLRLVGMEGSEKRNATMLSGGQQQRVAVARALAYNPGILLFDEPLSNLDAKLREKMRLELKQLQSELNITTIYVTHDQVEAMVMSDRIIIMKEGRIQQVGTPADIYSSPLNRFVADFIGVTNLLEGKITEVFPGGQYCRVEINGQGQSFILQCQMPKGGTMGDVTVSLRPEDLKISEKSEKLEKGNCIKGKLLQKLFLGNMFDCRVLVGNKEMRVDATKTFAGEEGQDIYLTIEPERCLCLPE